jgi:hypothetical protein
MMSNLDQYKTVQTWIAGIHEQSRASPENDVKRLQILAEFCTLVERDPDQIIDECLRDVEGGKKIRVKGRRFYAETVTEFEQQAEGSMGEKRQKANYIRSFLIHNGVLLQTSPLS